MVVLFLTVVGYLLGSVPTGKLVGNFYGVDIQKQGSGNIGFANTIRVLGWGPAFVVLVGDGLKGFLPVFTALQIHTNTYQVCLVAVLTVLGNIFPVWLRFRGGKGVATGLGISLAINPWLAGAGLGVYLIVVALARRSAPASLVGAWSMPVFALTIAPAYLLLYIGLAMLAIWTHRANIKQLIRRPVVYDD